MVTKYVKYLAISIVTVAAFICFAFALFFGVAGLLSITNVSLADFVVLVAFFVLFSSAGSSFATCADMLYTNIRRKVYG